MVNLQREGLGLLLKLGRIVGEIVESTEEPEAEQFTVETYTNSEPMKAYWESDKKDFKNKNQPFIDLFLKGSSALERIPDATEEPIKESHYNLDRLKQFLPDAILDNIKGVPETPKTGTGISSSGRDSSVVAGIVIAVITGVVIFGALIAFVLYRHYMHRNVPSMNFDNPVYRKTTENQFALEQNGYAPGSKLYPSTVGEEAQEPLNTPGTNEYV